MTEQELRQRALDLSRMYSGSAAYNRQLANQIYALAMEFAGQHIPTYDVTVGGQLVDAVRPGNP